jgi:hypothetical protein
MFEDVVIRYVHNQDSSSHMCNTPVPYWEEMNSSQNEKFIKILMGAKSHIA